jgi:hypothetical protein
MYSENTQRRAGEEAHAEFIYIYTHSSDAIHVALASHIERTTSPFIYSSWRRRRKGARRRNSGGVGWMDQLQS